jgi:TnpA family transposase
MFNTLELPTFWGMGKNAAVDGTMIEMFKNNVISEYHIRYGRNGGIMFHLFSDMYVALIGTFIPCGAWEAIYLLDLLIKNKSDIQPNTIHGDTQGQSGTVFSLSYLLGVNFYTYLVSMRITVNLNPYFSSYFALRVDFVL